MHGRRLRFDHERLVTGLRRIILVVTEPHEVPVASAQNVG
jgi:hypothetical protein